MIIRIRSARLRRWNKLDPLTFAAAPCASLSQDVGKRGVALRSLHVDGKGVSREKQSSGG
jgi:hypothetical protein